MIKQLPSGRWFIDCRFNGIRIRESADSKDAATRLLILRQEEIKSGSFRKYEKTFEELAQIFLKKEVFKYGKASQAGYKRLVELHLLPFFKGKNLGKIIRFNHEGHRELTKYLESISDIPKSTFNKRKRVLAWILKLGAPEFRMPEKHDPGYVKCRNEGFSQNRFLDEDEILSIIKLLSEKYKPLGFILAYTGIDVSEAVNLKWSCIKQGRLILPRSKTNVLRRIPIAPKLQPIFGELSRVRAIGEDRIFPDHKKSGLTSSWKRAAKKAGLEWARLKDARHFFASHLINMGVDSLTVANLMGHKDVKMLRERYGHFGDSHLDNAMRVFG